MKLSFNWLRQYIDHGLNSDELAHRLTMAGLEVEAVEHMGDDVVFEIEVTPNRPDCLNTLGLAREVSAIVDKDLKIPEISEMDDSGNVDINIEDAESCGRYIGTIIEGVQVKSLPGDKARILQALGLKPVSNIVDITNFVLFEYGQPLHAFDLDKLEGGKIIVRRARKGEKIVALDDIEYELDETILVIADAVKPVAIAGIMGGRDTGVTSSTKRILLESAYFDLGMIRRASRKLGLTSDSAYRFERSVAWKGVETGSARATDMIVDLAGGKVVAKKDVIAKSPETSRCEIRLSMEDISNLLGAPLELARSERILKRLGCIVAISRNDLTVIPPSYRQDLKRKEDVVEEIARVIGYDNLPMTLPMVKAINIPANLEKEKFFSFVERCLVGQGFHQIMTYSLISRDALQKSRYNGATPIALQNPMSAEQEIMRPSMLPGFLTVAATNIHSGQRDLRLFEVAKRYLPGGERWTLGIMMSGRRDTDWRRAKKEMVDFYDLKGAVDAVIHSLRLPEVNFRVVEDSRLTSGQSTEVLLGGKVIGKLGQVASDLVQAWDIKKTVLYFAEIDLEDLREQVLPQEKYELPDEYPGIGRDISLAVKDISYADILRVCQEHGGEMLRKIDFVEMYTGDKIESGYKGYMLSLFYQSRERTLTDVEVNGWHENLIQMLIEKLGVKRR